MQTKIIWQQGSSNPENADNFQKISEWWSALHGKEVTWRQRIAAPTAPVEDLNWEPQRFDEAFVISNPQIRGITLFWAKPDAPEEKGFTASKLELHNLSQHLYIYLQSQKDVVIRVGLPEINYQVVEVTNPSLHSVAAGAGCVLILKDDRQLLELRVALTSDRLNQLKQLLP